jgi:hypothetical protein
MNDILLFKMIAMAFFSVFVIKQAPQDLDLRSSHHYHIFIIAAKIVGSAGFEPAASSAQGWHHTKLDNDPFLRRKLTLSECNFNLMNK